MVGAEAIEALGREILEALKRRTGARGEGYVLWGLTPEELIASLEGLAKEVPALAPQASPIRGADPRWGLHPPGPPGGPGGGLPGGHGGPPGAPAPGSGLTGPTLTTSVAILALDGPYSVCQSSSSLGLSAFAQTCQVRYTAPDYPELPVGPPQVRLTLSPSVVTANGAVVQVSATTTAPGATAWVRVRWQGGALATRDAPYPGYAPSSPLTPFRGAPR
jgi:hypothetical protein